ncbi:MAG: MFS transporter [Helicobacteraceae bacterium]|jgi:MFS family permease|nr:MFS transporter [Helicobacteraceae bacterium]
MRKRSGFSLSKLTLWLLACLTMLSGTVIAASLPGISSHFVSGSDGEIMSRLILTIPALTVALVAPVAGLLIHRFGKKRLIYIALVFYAAAGVTGLFVESIWTLLAGRIGLGASIAVMMTAGTSLIGDYFVGRERERFLSVQGAFITLGGVFFLTGGGMLSDISWRAPFGVYFVSLLLIPLVYKGLCEPEPIKTHTKKEAGIFGKGGYWDVFPVFCVAFFTMLIFFIVPTQLPFLVMEHMGGSGKEVGVVMGIGPLFGAAAALSYAKIRERLSIKKVYIIVCALQGVGLGVVGLADEVWQLYAPFVCVGIGSGLAMANANAWFLDLAAAPKRAKLSGILTGSFFLGQFCSPLFVHPFLLFMPLSRVFSLFGCFLLIAALLLVLTRVINLPRMAIR